MFEFANSCAHTIAQVIRGAYRVDEVPGAN